MADLIVTEFISLDGVMEAPGGEPGYVHTGWAGPYMGEEQVELKFAQAQAVGSHLLGRVTYESFAAGWSGREGSFAERINSMPKYVVTGSPEEVTWTNSTALAGDPIAAVRELKEAESKSVLVVGSRTLVHSLLAAGLVDELQLMVIPVALGSGARLFPASEHKVELRLTESRRFANGVLENTYRVV
ncbi:MAG: dihydrofolate reductase family protein [Actinobacteria bacterium]|nr:dihydrofolate reductase family protein [Actinomycetota bacterium]